MKHIAKKISCIALTAALLAGGMPVQVLADSPKTQQEQPVLSKDSADSP